MKKIIALILFLTPSLAGAVATKGFVDLEGYGNGDPVGMTAKRTRGDFTIQETLASGDSLFLLSAYGFNGTSMTTTPRGQLGFFTSQAWTTSNNGTYFTISVTTNSSTTMSETVRVGNIAGQAFLKINPNLDITVSTPTSVGQLGITSAGVLYVSTSAVTTSSWVKVGAQ